MKIIFKIQVGFLALIFLLTASCSKDSDPIGENLDMETPVGYRLISKAETHHVENSVYSTVYIYNEDSTIKETLLTASEYPFATVRKVFIYSDDFIIRITNKNESMFVNNTYDSIDFEYNNDGMLISSIHTVGDASEQDITRATYSYVNNTITIKKSVAAYAGESLLFGPSEYTEILLLNEDGKFESRASAKNDVIDSITYDDKTNPLDLVYPKYLLGYTDYGSGNLLTYGSVTFEYIYNQYGYPTECKRYNNELIEITTTYNYNIE